MNVTHTNMVAIMNILISCNMTPHVKHMKYMGASLEKSGFLDIRC